MDPLSIPMLDQVRFSKFRFMEQNNLILQEKVGMGRIEECLGYFYDIAPDSKQSSATSVLKKEDGARFGVSTVRNHSCMQSGYKCVTDFEFDIL